MNLSIITINYNNAIGLQKTINSVLNQSFIDYEYIIIDGNSKDGSKDLLKSIKNPNFKYISEPDSGIYNAMNKGIKLAIGKYVLFLNSGDFLFNTDVLFNIKDYLTHNESFLSGHLFYIKEGKEIIKEHPEKVSFSYLVSNSISHPSTFIRKDMFYKHGLYNESNRIVSDWEFFLKALALNGETYLKIPHVITVFDTNGISNIKNIKNVESERQKVLKHYLGSIYNSKWDTFIFNQFINPSKHIKLLINIEKNPFLRKIATATLLLISKFKK